MQCNLIHLQKTTDLKSDFNLANITYQITIIITLHCNSLNYKMIYIYQIYNIQSNTNMNSQRFYQIMDIIQQYDVAITQIHQSFSQATLDLAYIKFINPYSSISTTGFQSTPALLRFDKNQNKAIFTSNNQFVKKIDQRQFLLFQEQSSVQQNIKILLTRDDLSQEQKIISRFGSISNVNQTIKASKSFRKCLDQLISFAALRQSLINKLKQLQIKDNQKKTNKNEIILDKIN